MNRILSIAIVFLAAISANANGADRFARESEGTQISTTGRIVKIDFKNKTIRMRGSDGQTISVRNVSQNISQWMQGVKQKVGVTLPGGITIALPGGRNTKNPTKQTDEPSATNNLEEYTVVVTKDTVFQDGSDPLRLEDFRAGETVSIRGILDGSTLTASRIAKWF
jgi:Domain of unknown function (DUF5666)